ncbi:4Fe-4S dicluster domain-containing protein [Clostridium sp.]|jgi:Na+-translocating ferredoxin:NAD+ oxidoreductase RnfC subunit|uniref:4Fe-4S dicluster domain-containing protein n=1 Tax=Clostridium sp. TaxID=1506 RepID=UPI003EE87E6A
MSNDLIEIIRSNGIVGAGGAGFPAHVKFSAKAEYVILNCAECEPLLRVDQQLIILYADEIIEALEQIMKQVDAKGVFIGIKKKHKEATYILQEKLREHLSIVVFPLEDFYPAGDEQTLVNEITGRIVPEAGIPLKVGCIVTNVETVLNLYNALKGKPVTHTYLTITGKVIKPVTLRLPVGISVREVLTLVGIHDISSIQVIDGGPMMGKIVSDIDSPITKTTKGLVVLPKEHILIIRKNMTPEMAIHQSKAACLQCRMCTDLCPRYLFGHNLQPHLMMRKSNYDKGNSIEGAEMASLCSECSICELYACPAQLSPRLINIKYKQKLHEKNIKYIPIKTVYNEQSSKEYRKIPVKRLIGKLGLREFDTEATLEAINYEPKKVRIPLKQHIGNPCIPVVQLGQLVNLGDLLGEIPENALGARIHASIDGIVTEISNHIKIERI